MADGNSISDEHLTAYLDGELSVAENSVIDVALKTDGELRSRLEALQIPVDALQDAFDEMLGEAPQMPVLEDEVVPNKTGFAQQFVGLAAALIIGVGLGSAAFRPQSEPGGISGWMEYVAAYQALYVSETLNSPDLIPDTEVLAHLSKILGANLNVAEVASDLSYRRAQVLGFEGKNLVQIAYLAEGGVPVALCVIQSDRQGRSDPRFDKLEGMQAASWHSNGFEYLLIGGNDAGLIKSAAQDFSAVL
jgi:anti-sigma factor RsiW